VPKEIVALKTIKDTREGRDKYAEELYEEALQYEEDVLSGKIVASKKIIQAVHRRRNLYDKKYSFSKEKVLQVFKFFYYVRITVDNKPVRFVPLPWMSWTVLSIYGYFRDETLTKRVIRFATIFVARKSAKTTFAAILSLYSFLKEERNAESYFCGNTKDQASQALRYLKQIVKDSPALKKAVKLRQFRLESESERRGSCVARPVANEPDTLDGLSPSFAIIDEKHAMSTNDLFNIMKTGTLARTNPLIVTISTAGFNREYPFYNEIEIGKKVLDGELEDDSTFYAIFQLDEEEEIDIPKMWAKANPSLKDENGRGVISLDDLIADYGKACLIMADKKNFITKNLNMFVDGEDAWLPDEDYKRCGGDTNIKEFFGQKVYLGIDLSTSRDLSSLVAVMEHPETGKLTVFPEFYFPSDSQEKKIRASGIDLTEWIDKDYIREHSGRIVSYDEIFERIQWWCDNFDVQAIGYDPWNATMLVARVEAEIMVDMKPCKQNTGFYNFPMKYFERLIYSEAINVSKNPVMRWNVKNIVVYMDGNGNIKPMKNKSLDSIDGVIALLMALGMYAEINFDAVSALMENLLKQD
jgi:phage terminase large subunit-like protein